MRSGDYLVDLAQDCLEMRLEPLITSTVGGSGLRCRVLRGASIAILGALVRFAPIASDIWRRHDRTGEDLPRAVLIPDEAPYGSSRQ
jgi:hypothetical protein